MLAVSQKQVCARARPAAAAGQAVAAQAAARGGQAGAARQADAAALGRSIAVQGGAAQAQRAAVGKDAAASLLQGAGASGVPNDCPHRAPGAASTGKNDSAPRLPTAAPRRAEAPPSATRPAMRATSLAPPRFPLPLPIS